MVHPKKKAGGRDGCSKENYSSYVRLQPTSLSSGQPPNSILWQQGIHHYLPFLSFLPISGSTPKSLILRAQQNPQWEF